jgi:hypothetical protein
LFDEFHCEELLGDLMKQLKEAFEELIDMNEGHFLIGNNFKEVCYNIHELFESLLALFEVILREFEKRFELRHDWDHT